MLPAMGADTERVGASWSVRSIIGHQPTRDGIGAGLRPLAPGRQHLTGGVDQHRPVGPGEGQARIRHVVP